MAARGVDADRRACRERLGEVARRTGAGQSARQISWDLRVATRTVTDYRARARTGGWEPYAGVAPRELPAGTVAEVASRYAAGQSQRGIAAALGITRSAVIAAMGQAGTEPRTASEANAQRWRRSGTGDSHTVPGGLASAWVRTVPGGTTGGAR